MLQLMSSINSSISLIFIIGILVVLAGAALKKIRQPLLIGYIIIGVGLGEYGLDAFTSKSQIEFLGEIGIILLFFFIGMEISLPNFVKQWKVALIGTYLQILLSVLIVLLVGHNLGWSFSRSIVLGFVIALSSSAVVIKLLEDKKMLHTQIGKNVLSILLTQDIAIAPILILTAFLGGRSQSITETGLQILGALIIFFIIFILYKKENIQFPWLKTLEEDHEMQVFISIVFCSAGALLMAVLGLSPALGAFIAGLIVHAAKETDWIHDNLHPFRIIFVAIFFISVGAQININFLLENLNLILLMLLIVFIVNQFINAIILRFFGSSWKASFYGGAMLAQIGEMSFLVCFTAYTSPIISEFGYNFSICLIALTLLFSPLWIALTEKIIGRHTLPQ